MGVLSLEKNVNTYLCLFLEKNRKYRSIYVSPKNLETEGTIRASIGHLGKNEINLKTSYSLDFDIEAYYHYSTDANFDSFFLKQGTFVIPKLFDNPFVQIQVSTAMDVFILIEYDQ